MKLSDTLTYSFIVNFKLAYKVAKAEIVARYRRSFLGTLWYTISTIAIVFGLGPLYATIFKVEVGGYFVYIAFGIIFWNFVQGAIVESCGNVIQHESLIKDLSIHYATFSVSNTIKHFLILAQNFIAIYLVFLTQKSIHAPSVSVFVLPVLLLEGAVLTYVGFVISLVSARFRDFTPIVNIVMQLFFFLTPILWQIRPDIAQYKVVQWNPIYFLIELPRGYILNGSIDVEILTKLVAIAVASLFLAEVFHRRYAKRFVFWI
jgi:lipopolysaccharide transport system permease protein